MALTPQQIAFYAGDTNTVTIQLNNEVDGSSFSPVNHHLIFTAKTSNAASDLGAKFQYATGVGIVHGINAAAVSFHPVDTREYGGKVLQWDIQAENLSTGVIATVAIGTLSLKRDTTRKTTTSVPLHTVTEAVPHVGPTGPAGPAGDSDLIIQSIIHNSVSKTTPVDLDEFGLVDSTASFGLKKLTWSNLKIALQSLFYTETETNTLLNAKANLTGGNTFNGTQTISVCAIKDQSLPFTSSISVPSGTLGANRTVTLPNASGVMALTTNPNGSTSDIELYAKAGLAIAAARVVYITGASGANVIIGLAQANDEATSSRTIGICKQNLATNGFGYVVTEGNLTGISVAANGAVEGDPVFLSPTTPGGMVFGLANKPSAPNHMVYLGVIKTISGLNVTAIYVKVQNGFELDELHDVAISSPVSGQSLFRNGSNLWVNRAIVSADVSDASKDPVANTVAKRDADGGGVTFGTENSTYGVSGISSGRAVYGFAYSNGTGVYGYAHNDGTGIQAVSASGTYHALFGDTGSNRSFIAQVNGALGWFRGAFTGRIQAQASLTGDRTYTLPDATGNIVLDTTLNAILAAGPAASRDALTLGTAAPTDVIDSLKWTRKSLVNSANTGVVNSVRVLVTGDSIGVDGWPKSAFNVFGKSTTAFRLSPTSPTRGGAATYETLQFAYWPSGNISKTTGASDTLIYPTSTTGFFRGSFRICYITEPGAGTFKIEQRASGSTGAWTDNWVTLESDISADGILGSAIKTYALSGGQNQIRITGMSGVVRYIGVAVIPTDQHVLEICAAEGGTTPVQQNTTPTSILGPILTSLTPTVCFWRGYESQEDLTTALPAFTAKLLSVVPNMDMVLTGLHPMTVISDEENIARNAIVSAHARAIGGTFIDAFTPFKDTATMSSLGYLLDGLHLNNQGNVEVQYVQTASLPTLEANAKYPLNKYMLNEGIVGSSSPAFNIQGTGLTATRLGFSPQIGSGPGFYLPSNYSGYPAGSLFFQFNSINSKLKFDGNGLWAADFGTIPYATGLNRAGTGSIEGTAYSVSKPGLVAAGISGQTANIFEVRTGASIGTAGTIASGFNSAGVPFSSVIPIKADDAAADADAAIPSGGYYRITGSRVLYVKP